MCGIAGILGQGVETKQRMSCMLKAQKHRGPDATGTLSLGEMGILGHNRLSIIDLSTAANQPLICNEGRYSMVFNGEIYNYIEIKKAIGNRYQFRTNSDSEVLLAAYLIWGKACLHRLKGMFAFAIWDKTTKSLFAARDRFGVKPFNYAIQNNTLFFASEIKSLWAAGIPKQPNEKVWAGYFAKGTYGTPNETFWLGIHQLPGGHYFTWADCELKIESWYNFKENIDALEPPSNEAQLKEKWSDLALESIKLRFRADVKVGFNISGGLDSSLLLGLVHRQFGTNDSIEAFTFTTGDNRYDELPWATSLIEQTNFPLNNIQLSVADVPDYALSIAKQEDEPFGGLPTLAYAKIFEAARQRGILVLLDGQGMDEAWAGYDYYLKTSNTLVQGSNSSPVRPNCLNPDFLGLTELQNFPTHFDNQLQKRQYRDLFFTKIPRALRFNDRVSMLYGTELREPFLDHEMVELAFSLPPMLKINKGQQKWLARQIAKEFLSESITLAPKRPLQTPQREWLAEDLNEWSNEWSNNLLVAKPEWFLKDHFKQEMNAFKDGFYDNSFFVWQWVNAGMLLNN